MKKKRVSNRNVRLARYVIYRETLINPTELFWSFLGSFIGIAVLAYLHFEKLPKDFPLLIGSFGATAVLVYGAIQSPLAQPRNLIGGHVLSAIVGVTIQKLFPETTWIAAPLAVSLSILLMQITKTLHPPGGATALIATIGSDQIKNLGYWYVLSPVLSGVLILFIVALIFNNITKNRRYPYANKYYKWVHYWPKKMVKRS